MAVTRWLNRECPILFLCESSLCYFSPQEYSHKIGDNKRLSEYLKLPIQRINDFQVLIQVTEPLISVDIPACVDLIPFTRREKFNFVPPGSRNGERTGANVS